MYRTVVIAAAMCLSTVANAVECMREPVLELHGARDGTALSPDGDLFILTHPVTTENVFDQRVDFIDIPSGRVLQRPSGQQASITADGRFAVVSRSFAGSGSKSIDLASGREIADWISGSWPSLSSGGAFQWTFNHERFFIHAIPDGRLAWSQPFDNGNTKVAFGNESVAAVISSPGTNKTGRRDIQLIDLVQAKEIGRLSSEFVPQTVKISFDGRHLAAGDFRQVALWDLQTRRLLQSSAGIHFAFLRDGRLLAYGGGTPTTIVHPERLDDARNLSAHGNYQGELYGNLLLFRNGNQFVVVDGSSLQPRYTLLSGDSLWRQPDDRSLIVRADASSYAVHDAGSGQELCRFSGGELVHSSKRYVVLGVVSTDNMAMTYRIYRFETPAAGRERERKLAATALARSATLSPAQRAEVQAMFKQGFELFQAGEFEAAVRRFTKGLELDPANGLGHFYLAETYARQEKKSLAREHYQSTIRFAPQSKEAAIAEARLEAR